MWRELFLGLQKSPTVSPNFPLPLNHPHGCTQDTRGGHGLVSLFQKVRPPPMVKTEDPVPTKKALVRFRTNWGGGAVRTRAFLWLLENCKTKRAPLPLVPRLEPNQAAPGHPPLHNVEPKSMGSTRSSSTGCCSQNSQRS